MRKAGFKQYAFLGLFTAALVSGACSDDDDDAPGGGAGKGGSTSGAGGSSAGKSSGGSSSGGTKNGTAGSGAAGSSNGGTGTGIAGTAPTAGTEPVGGTAPNAGTGGTSAGAGGEGTDPAVNGGESGAPAGGMGGGEPGSGGEAGAAPIVYATLVNPGFELGTTHMVPTGWTNEGTDGAAYYEANGPHTGTGKLTHWISWDDAHSYQARTYQTLDPIENGTYSFSIWVERTDVETAQYLFAKGFDVSNPDAEVKQDTTDANAPAGFVKITLSGIAVTSGKITVGVFTDNWGGNYVGFDDAELVKE